jgi:hypothetical protein
MERVVAIDCTKARARARAIAVAINHKVTPHPTFPRACQNVATATMPLDTLPAPSTDGVGKVYQQLKGILDVAAEQQAESSLQHQAEGSVLSPGCSKASRQRTTIEHTATGIASSPVWAQSHLRPGHPSRPLELVAHRQAHRENEGLSTKYRTHNQHRCGRNDREQCSLSPEEPGPKAFGSNMHNACFPKHFRAPNNIIKYDGKTNPSVWLEDYHLT